MSSSPHVLVVPWPAQGHVTPLTHLSHSLSNHGFKITFIVVESSIGRVSAASSETGIDSDQIHLISVPTKFTVEEGWSDPSKVFESLEKEISSLLEQVIKKSKQEGEAKITCMIVDGGLAWALETGRKMGLCTVAFSPAPAALLATFFSIPKLIKDGVITTDGQPKHEKVKFQLSPNAPFMDTTCFMWKYFGHQKAQETMFRYVMRNGKDTLKFADFILCNSSQDLEPHIFTNFPNILSVGPLPILDRGQEGGKPIGRIWSEDNTCMAWLDQQPANSVIYIAFGTITTRNRNQLEELALGLEISSDRPFLWVIVPDLVDMDSVGFLNQFKDRVKRRGKIVKWCNQEMVLAHPSIACFVSHCGWNSTLDGVKNGVPFLCCPSFLDQFLCQNYICDSWKIGLRLVENESMTITKERVHLRLMELLADDEMKKRAERMKEMIKKCISEGGSSFVNLISFINAVKK